MKRVKEQIYSIFLRYIIILLAALPNFWIFYAVFTPLTIYPVYFLLSLFFETYLIGSTIYLSGIFPIEVIEACIAGSAYYLLFILNLSVPNVKLKKRLQMILFAFIVLLIMNILRIFVLSLLFTQGVSWFDLAHQALWYVISVLFVVAVWFLEIKIFKIKDIPIYSDLKFLFSKTKIKFKPLKKTKKSKRKH